MDTPFFGGSYESFSSNLANDRCMNLYAEVVESKQGKAIGGFYSTPGLRQWLAIGTGPIRGLAVATGQNKLVVVSGNTVYTLDMNAAVATLGTLSTTSGPVSILTNATQVFVCDGLNGWVYSGGLWQKTVLVTPAVGCQQDGFGLVNQVGTNQVWQSNLNDFTVWDGLNFTSIDSEPSPVIGMVDLFRQVWFMKQASCEIWNNAGLNGFAFQRMQGAFLEQGCIAPASVCNAGDRILWLGQDARGQGVVYTTHGYQGARASNHAVEAAMLGYSMLSDAVAYVYQQMGHTFYVLNFPTGNATWVYDVHLGLWHQRGEFANGEYARHDGNCHASWQGMELVGSASQGVIYQYDMAYGTDDVANKPDGVNPKRWARRWRALKQAAYEPVRFPALQIDMQTGVQVGQTNNSGSILTISGALGNHFIGDVVDFLYAIASTYRIATVTIIDGALPDGLSIDNTGRVTGTATTAGSFSWTVKATDVNGKTATLPDNAIVTPLQAALFDGSTGVLSAPMLAPILGNGDFTVQARISPHTFAIRSVISTRSVLSYATGWALEQSANSISEWRQSTTGVNMDSTSNLQGSNTIPVNQMMHMAVTRSGNLFTLWLNGVNINSKSITGSVTEDSTHLGIGTSFWDSDNPSQSENLFNGYMDWVSVHIGTCLYSDNFNPPVQPPESAQILLAFDEPLGSTTFTDTGTLGLTWTTWGSVVIAEYPY